MPSFVGYVPTHPDHLNAFFELAPPSSSDVVYDLGSGDGRLVFAALDHGVGRAIGIELDADLVKKASASARKKGLDSKATFIHADLIEVKLCEATVVFSYLCPAAWLVLRDKFESELKPGTRVVVEAFPIPGWKAESTASRGYPDYYEINEFYLYVMPQRHGHETTNRERRATP